MGDWSLQECIALAASFLIVCWMLYMFRKAIRESAVTAEETNAKYRYLVTVHLKDKSQIQVECYSSALYTSIDTFFAVTGNTIRFSKNAVILRNKNASTWVERHDISYIEMQWCSLGSQADKEKIK